MHCWLLVTTLLIYISDIYIQLAISTRSIFRTRKWLIFEILIGPKLSGWITVMSLIRYEPVPVVHCYAMPFNLTV